jgi:hypothetical protein
MSGGDLQRESSCIPYYMWRVASSFTPINMLVLAPTNTLTWPYPRYVSRN